jgi:enoyl-CoA hydratase
LNDANSKVLFEQTDKVFEFKLNNNKTLNAIDQEMVTIMAKQLKKWHDAPKEEVPRVALISGTGGKAFCAGGDIVSLYHANNGKEGYDPKSKATFFADEYMMDYSLTTMSPLQISIWNGIVMGGGVGVSCHAPIRVATDNTMYAMPETGIGFFTDVGGSYFLSRIKGDISLGMYLGLTGHRLKAKDLVKWGVATHFVSADKIEPLKEDLFSNVTSESTNEEILNIVNWYSDEYAAQEPIENLP